MSIVNSLTPLSIYVHIPFCIKKCRYCDFLSYPASDAEKDAYIELLLSEIELQSPFFDDYKVISVFIGGGTPSILDGSAIESILCKLKAAFHIEKDCEITIETNPATVTEDKLETYLRCGINRISIGLQSADDGQLAMLGRVHGYRDFCAAYELAAKSGFKNINVDIMSAIPGQTTASYRATIEKVLEFEPQHISAYSLILEEGTWFYEHQKELEFPTEDEDREQYELTARLLSRHGYHRYEISNYAKDGFECVHNKVYWQRGSYLGLGLGAASMVENVRWSNERTFDEYKTVLRQRMGRDVSYLTKKEQMEEFMFLGLRMTKGVKKADFEKEFGVSIEDVYKEVIKKMQKDGLVEADDYIRLTPFGMDVSNYVMAEFLL